MLPNSWKLVWSRWKRLSLTSKGDLTKRNQTLLKLEDLEERATPATTGEGGLGGNLQVTLAYTINGNDEIPAPGTLVEVGDTPELGYSVTLGDQSLPVVDFVLEDITGGFGLTYTYNPESPPPPDSPVRVPTTAGAIQMVPWSDPNLLATYPFLTYFNVGDVGGITTPEFPDGIPNGTLDPGETWEFVYVGDLFVVPDTTSPTGEVRTAEVEVVNPMDSSDTLRVADSEIYFALPSSSGENPGVGVTALLDGQEYEVSPGKYYFIDGSDNADFEYTITNTGDAPLRPLSIVDDNGSNAYSFITIDDNGTPDYPDDDIVTFDASFGGDSVGTDGILDVNETWTFARSDAPPMEGTIRTDITADFASVDTGTQVSATDFNFYTGLTADLDLELLVNGDSGTTAAAPLYVLVEDGNTVTYAFNLTTTGTGVVDETSSGIWNRSGQGVSTPSGTFADASFQDGDVSGGVNGALDAGETYAYTLTEPVLPGLQTIDATGLGNAVVPEQNPDPSNSPTLPVNSDQVEAYYFGVLPGVAVDMKLDGQDYFDAPGKYFIAGDDGTFTYEVTNTGNVPLHNVTAVDDNGTPNMAGDDITLTLKSGDNGNNILEDGEVWIYERTDATSPGQVTNSVLVTAEEQLTGDNNETTATDRTNYFGVIVDVEIDLKINGEDNDVAPGFEVLAGNNVPFTYFVTAPTSNLPLNIDSLVDDNGTPLDASDDFEVQGVVDQNGVNVGDLNGNGLLDPDLDGAGPMQAETWQFAANKDALADGPYEHTATVVASESNSGGTDTDTDSAFYFGVQPSVSITSQVNGEDADTLADSVPIEVGNTANFTYSVTNTGNRPLSNVVVVDDNNTPNDPTDDFRSDDGTLTFVGGDDDNDGELDNDPDGDGPLTGEVWLYTAEKVVETEDAFLHIAEVTATEAITNTEVDASNPNHYNGFAPVTTNPAIQLTKYVSVITDTDFDAENFTPIDDRGDDTTTTSYTLDFELDDNGDPLDPGTRISDQWSDWAGLGIKTIIGNQDKFTQYPPMIFDSANPSGGDSDLVTPGYHASNTEARENILIISEDNDANDPDDKASGGMLEFTWTSGVDLDWIGLLDLDANETGNKVITYDENGNVLESLSVQPPPGDNSWAEVGFQQSSDVYRLEVYFPRSGAVTDLVFSTTAESRELFDANEPGEVTAEVGNGLIFDYDVSNTGDVSLTNVVVMDDNATPNDQSDDFAALPVEVNGFNVGDTNTNDLLDPGETWFFQEATDVTAEDQGSSFTNTATVTADVVGQSGQSVTDDDLANWTVPEALQFEGFVQDSEGLISIDVNNYDNQVSQNGYSWIEHGNGSDGNSLTTSQNTGTLNNSNYETNSPRLDYKVVFNRTGVHYLWIRGIGTSGKDDSVHAGLDGEGVNTADRISSFGTGWTWSKSTMDNVRATINVTSEGEHTINLWMREDGFIVDKILVTSDPNYIPYGAGPSESPRAETGATGGTTPAGNSSAPPIHEGTSDANGNLTMFWEAEAFYSNSGFDVNQGQGASGGQYVGTNNGAGTSLNSSNVDQEIVYKVDLDTADEFYLFGLTKSPTDNDNSFWVQVDGGEWILWDTTVSNDWTWDEVKDRNDQARRSFTLSEGEHTIRIRLREDGTQLDQLMLTNDTSYQPGT
ncbi:MAG: hypothetical protein ACFCD0_27465 [Gemmataceae bacterium]